MLATIFLVSVLSYANIYSSDSSTILRYNLDITEHASFKSAHQTKKLLSEELIEKINAKIATTENLAGAKAIQIDGPHAHDFFAISYEAKNSCYLIIYNRRIDSFENKYTLFSKETHRGINGSKSSLLEDPEKKAEQMISSCAIKANGKVAVVLKKDADDYLHIFRPKERKADNKPIKMSGIKKIMWLDATSIMAALSAGGLVKIDSKKRTIQQYSFLPETIIKNMLTNQKETILHSMDNVFYLVDEKKTTAKEIARVPKNYCCEMTGYSEENILEMHTIAPQDTWKTEFSLQI